MSLKSWWEGKRPDPVIVPRSTVSIPAMTHEAMVETIRAGQGGPSLAMLVYSEQSYEIISGSWSIFIDSTGSTSYWVADICVAVTDTEGNPYPLPNLVHLSIGKTLSAAQLATERITAA